ncbi:MAG TPA: hypothetical protein VIV11_14075 [Kofleriaceae bacterium]
MPLQADAKPRGDVSAALASDVLYEQHLPIQIVFIGVKPGVACPANPTFDPWLDLNVPACTTAADSFSPVDVDENVIRRVLPARVRPAIGSSSNRVAMAVVPDYRFAYAQNAFAAGLATHLFGDGTTAGIGTRLPEPAFAHWIYSEFNLRRIGRIEPSIVPAIDESWVVDPRQTEQYLLANLGAMGTTDRSGAPIAIDPRYPTFFIINLFGQPNFKFHDYVVPGGVIALVARGGSAGRRSAFLDVSAGPELLAESWSIDVCADSNGDGKPDQAASDWSEPACFLRTLNNLEGNAAHLVPVWEYFNPNPLATASLNSLDFVPNVYVDPALGYFRSRFTVDLSMYLRFVAVNIHSIGYAIRDPMDNVLPYNRQTSGGPASYYPADFAALQRFAIQRTIVRDPGTPALANTGPLLLSQLQALEPRDYSLVTTEQPLDAALSDVWECRNSFYNSAPGESCYSPMSSAQLDTVTYVHDHEQQFMASPTVANLPFLDFSVDPSRIVSTRGVVGPRTLPGNILGISYFDPMRAGNGHIEATLAWNEAWLRPIATVHEAGHAFGVPHLWEGIDNNGFFRAFQPWRRFAIVGQQMESAMSELFDVPNLSFSPFEQANHRRILIARLVTHIAFLDAAIRASSRAGEVTSALEAAATWRASAIADADGLDGLDAARRGYFALLVGAQQIHAEPPASAWPGSQRPQGMAHEIVDHRTVAAPTLHIPYSAPWADSPEPAEDSTGCNAGGGTKLAPLFVALMLVLTVRPVRRRRRR